ncbi:cytochrome b/b6 domain-containing protein [Noviherbaspirillum galbum]|uniref:Cytochrome B n=1 Tax=Noviherbaspirillum galbum TaxID=2709383 RepID=A0A6B3SKQ3_9BURK|nr:cytochrome b/b6 domain-containing protein [Noviherbaspirillum galbum]NEX61424.1 cytochrome B [Noviherbaspirillum galbum]
MKTIRVWDLPVRLFHWALALLVLAAVVTQKIGGNAMAWHFRCGYAILALLLFRILWGVVGSRYARFSSFIHGPSTIAGYIRNGKAALRDKALGHNPLGGLSILTMIGVLLAQAVGGLFSNDDIAYDGPLVKYISKEVSDRITGLHKDVGATLIYFLVALHVATIAYYFLKKRENLVKPMITGDAPATVDAPPAADSAATRLLALALLAVCGGLVYLLVTH